MTVRYQELPKPAIYGSLDETPKVTCFDGEPSGTSGGIVTNGRRGSFITSFGQLGRPLFAPGQPPVAAWPLSRICGCMAKFFKLDRCGDWLDSTSGFLSQGHWNGFGGLASRTTPCSHILFVTAATKSSHASCLVTNITTSNYSPSFHHGGR